MEMGRRRVVATAFDDRPFPVAVVILNAVKDLSGPATREVLRFVQTQRMRRRSARVATFEKPCNFGRGIDFGSDSDRQ
jgi:hypothetical protein